MLDFRIKALRQELIQKINKMSENELERLVVYLNPQIKTENKHPQEE